MSKWSSGAREYLKRKEQEKVQNAMSADNLLSRTGSAHEYLHKNDDGYTSLSKRWEDLYKRAVDYYNNEAYNGFYDTYSGTRNKTGYVADKDAGRWYSDLESQRDTANEGVDELLAELDQYSRYYNEDAVKYVRDLITKRQSSYDDVLKDAGAFRDQWSQYATEDDYNYALWENDFAKAYNAGDYDTAEKMLKEEADKLKVKWADDAFGLTNSEEYRKLLEYEEALEQGKEYKKYEPFIEKYGNMSREELINARDALGLAYHNAVSGNPSGADPLGLGKIDTTEMDRELQYVNYLINKDDPEVQAAWAAAEEEERKQKEIENAPWWQRTLSTVGDIINRGGYAIAQGLETVNDGLGRAFVGAGDFVNDVLDDIGKSSGRRNYNFQWENWKEDYLKGLDYEWAKDTFNIDEDFNTVEDFSYLSEVPELQNSVYGVIDGVGQMAPAIALGFATGGAGAGAAYMSTLAGGSAIDEALKEGADLDQAIVYGQAIAGLEGGSELLGGSVFGEATDLASTALGRWMIKSGADKYIGKGLGKAAYTFVSEGVEESIMDIATPAAKSALDIGDAQDKYFGENWQEGWGEVVSGIPETFVVGGAVGSVIEGFHSSVSALSNKDKGGFKYNKIADEMTIIENALKAQEAVKQSKNATPEIIDAFSVKTSEKVSASVQSISETMQKLTPAQRAEVFADAPMLEMFLNEDGGVSEGFKYFSAKGNTEIISLIDKISKGEFKDNEKIYLNNVSDDIAGRIQELTGVDVRGFRVAIEARQLRHILNDHGKSGKTDQSMINPEDISKLDYVLSNPDNITKSGKTQAYSYMKNGYNRTADTVLYEKNIGEQSYYAVQAIPDTKAKTLYIVTAFIGHSGYQKGASQLINANSPNATSKSGSANTPTSSISQHGTNVNSKISTNLARYAELAQMGENGVQLMQEVYDGKLSPEKFFEAYNAVYAAGKRGGEVRGRYVSLLGENVAAMARKAGQMDALKNGDKTATAYKAGERAAKDAAKDAEGGSPPASAVQNSSSLTQQNRTGGEADLTTRLVAYSPAPAGAVPSVTKGAADETRTGSQSEAAATSNVPHGKNNEGMSFAPAAAVPSGETREFKGSVTGRTYSAEAARLLSKAKIGGIDSNKSYYTLDALGIPKAEQQAWIDAGLAKERTVRGQTLVTVNTTVLKDEGKRRENSSKGLQNGGGSDTIESTQSRRENSDGQENKSGLLSGNTVSDGGGHSKISSEGKGTSGDVDSSRVHGESGRVGVLSEDSEGRRISSDTLSKISETAVVDEDGKPMSLYHATDKSFDKFAVGDIGFHFGLKEQADSRAHKKSISQPRYINAYLNIKNPLRVKSDYMNWHANSVALNLWNEGILSDAEMQEVVSLWSQGKNYDSPAAVKLREILESKGYDGIAYPNGFEGEGTSYIAFHDEQIVRVDENASPKNNQSSNTSDPDVQQAKKENAIESERVVYSSKKAIAYDAIPRDKLDAKQKKVVDVASQLGLKVTFATTVNTDGVEVDAFIAKNGNIYINPNKNTAPMAFVFKHELAHFAERAGQKYRDFKDAVTRSATFKDWLKTKGYNSMLEYNSQIRKERSEVGIDPGEDGANNEIIANFVGDMLFTDQGTWTEDLIRELGPKQRKTVREYIRDFFSWIKSKFVGDAGKAKVEVRKLEKAFGAAFRTAVESNAGTNGEQFAFSDSKTGRANDTLLRYNDELAKIISDRGDYIVDSFSKLQEVVNYAFDHPQEKATAYFGIIDVDTLSRIEKSIPNLPKDSKGILFKSGREYSIAITFDGIRHIVDGKNLSRLDVIDYLDRLADTIVEFDTVTYDVYTDSYGKKNNGLLFKKKFSDGTLVSFDLVSNKKRSIVLQTLYLDKANYQKKKSAETLLMQSASAHTPNAGVGQTSVRSTKPSERYAPSSYDYRKDTSINSISNSDEKNNSQNAQNFEDQTEQFSYAPQNDKVTDIFERIRSGELSLNDAEQLLKKSEGDNPASIANLKPEDMGTTPRVKKKTNGNVGDGDSKFAESVQKSSIFNDEFKAEVKDDNFIKHYASITNKETLAEAAKRLDEGGEAYVTDWLSKKAAHMDTVDTMVGFILLKRYQDIGDYGSAAAVAQKVREVGTLSGQRVQAFSIIGRFDADMMQTYAQKELDKAWELAIEGRSDKWLEKHKEQFKLTDEEISFIRDNILYAARMPENSRERAIALAQITSLIQNKIPPVKGQSFKAWQRISMLLNPKTQIRNVLGNAMMAPVFVASDWFSTPLDKLISKATGVRTTGLTGLHGNRANLKAAKKGIYESYDDWKRHINTKSADQNRFEIGQGKSFDETRWGRIAKIMNGFDRFTSFLLDAGDRPFYEMWFINSLNEQMRLNKVSEPTEAMVQIAVDEALSRTWQDDNRMTKLVSGIKKAANQISIGGYGMGDVLVKFTKTPANLTKAIYDFSPAAILSITPQAVRLTKAIKNGTATPSMQKKFVSNFGKMAAGTMLYVAFAALYAAGHIKGSSDEDKDVAAFEKYIQGIPEYSIKIGDKWFSYDWAQPIGAVPAIIANYMEAREEGSGAIDSVLGAFKAGGEVLFNQSFMTSFQTLFSADSFAEGFLDIALGEVSVPVPTIFSQLANVFDDKRRVTYDGTSEFQSALNRAMLKIPGLRNLLEAEVDVLGREVDNTQKSWFNAFFNPANVYTDTSTAVTDHAYEIYQSTGDVGAIPAKAPYSVKLQGKTVKLDDVQRAQYQRAMGETASDLIEILLENDVYKAMNDEEKLAVLKQVYSYSAAVAKDQLDWADDYEVISGIAPYITEKDFNAMSDEERYKIVNDYIFSDYEGMEDIESEIGQSNFIINKKTANLVLSATLVGDIDKAVELIDGIEPRVESYGWDKADTAEEIKNRKTSVKSTLTRYWKEAYLYAYYKKDAEEQERITDMLVKVKLYGDRNDVKEKLAEWVEAYEEENE